MKGTFILIMMLGAPIRADVISMNNGDRISGDVVKITGDRVSIKPIYSAKIDVASKDIAAMETDSHFKLELKSGERGEYQFSGADDIGRAILTGESSDIAVSLADIREVVEEDERLNWDGKVSFAQTLSRGNTNSQVANLNGSFQWRLDNHRTLFDISAIREEKESDRIKELDRLNVSYNWLYNNAWFFAINLTAERNPVALLDYRTSVNPSIGYDVWDEPTITLSMQLGAGYQEEQIANATGTSSLIDWRLRYKQGFRDGVFELFHNHQIHQNLQGRENLVFNSVTGLRYDITDDIYLNIQLRYDIDSEPVRGTDNEDLTFLFGAGIDL